MQGASLGQFPRCASKLLVSLLINMRRIHAISPCIAEYFRQWNRAVKRAGALLHNEEYLLEGLLVLSCYIGALARARFPKEDRDWKSYKDMVWEYSEQRRIYENIDLLLFYQWPRTKLAHEKIYKEIKNYSELVDVFKNHFGSETKIKENPKRYQKRENLINIIIAETPLLFDKDNFLKHIELFSNTQILYQFVRSEAVHNSDFPLFNATYIPEMDKQIYRDNHQLSRDIILATVKNLVENLEKECLTKNKWPWELSCV